MASLRELAEMLVKRISALTRTATSSDLTDGEFVAVDKTDGYTRKMTVANLATWVHNKWAAFVNARTTKTSFASGDKVPVVNGNTAFSMAKDVLLQMTSQNALAGNVTPLFDPNKPNDEGGYAYYAGTNVTYEGQNFVFIANHKKGPWNPLEVEQKPLSESINLQGVGEAVDEWLNSHPEATTTVQDGSLTKEKFSDLLQQECLNDYVTPEMFGAVGDGTADDTAAVQACLDYAFANKKSTYLSKSYKITASLDVHDWCVIRGNGGTMRSSSGLNIIFRPSGGTSLENPAVLFVCNDSNKRRYHHSFINVSIGKMSGICTCFGSTCPIDYQSIVYGCYISTFNIVFDGFIGHTSWVVKNHFNAIMHTFVNANITDSYILDNYISGYRPTAPLGFRGNITMSSVSGNFFDFFFGIFRSTDKAVILHNVFDYCFWVFGYTLTFDAPTGASIAIRGVISNNIFTNCASCHTSDVGFGSVLGSIAGSPYGEFKVKVLTKFFPCAICLALMKYNQEADTVTPYRYYNTIGGSIVGNVFDASGFMIAGLAANLVMAGNTYGGISTQTFINDESRIYISITHHTNPSIFNKHYPVKIDIFDYVQLKTVPNEFMQHSIYGQFQLAADCCTVYYANKLYVCRWDSSQNKYVFYDAMGNPAT